MQRPVSSEEVLRRKKAIRKALESCLTDDQMTHALMLCELEFATDLSFSATSFCQRLVETLPNLQLGTEARLLLLRTLRKSSAELGVQHLTTSIGIPHKLFRAEAKLEETHLSVPTLPSSQLDVPPDWPHDAKHSTPDIGPTEDGDELSLRAACSEPDISDKVVVNPLESRSLSHPLEVPKPDLDINKILQLKGHYWLRMEDIPTGEMVVTALSSTGLTLQMQNSATLQQGQQLSIEFKLDDVSATAVWQSITVDSVSSYSVEAAWRNSEALDDALKQYMTRK